MPQATYVVQQGDTYENIAQDLQNVTSQMLENANPNYPPAQLQSGNQINIPLHSTNATYVVQQGDTYNSIVLSLHNITNKALEDANPQYPPTNLPAGVQINVFVSAFDILVQSLFQPEGIPRGPVDFSIKEYVDSSIQKIQNAADQLANASDSNLQQLSPQLKSIFGEHEDADTAHSVLGQFSVLASGFGSALSVGFPVLGTVLNIFGGLFSFFGNETDHTMDEIKESLKSLESDIDTLNQNLINLGNLISNDFTQISDEIEAVIDEIKQVEKDIEIDIIVQLIDQNLTTVNDIVLDYLNMLANKQDFGTLKAKADLFLEDQAGSLHVVYDTLFQQVVDASSGISDSAFLDLLSNKMYLSNGNISYSLWYQAVQSYISKINFAIVQGCLAIAWATDVSNPSNSASVAEKYSNYLSQYFNKLYLLEPGLFYPLNDASLAFIGKDNKTELQFSFTRQATGDVVEIINTTNQDIELCQLQIITNYKMSDVNPGFWGDMLYPDPVRGSGWQGTLKDSTNPVIQEIIYDSYDSSSGKPTALSKPLFACYTIKYQNAKFLAGGKATLNMSFSSNPNTQWVATGLSGLQGAAMFPIISVVNSTYKQTLTCTNIALMDVNSKTHTLPDINTTTFKNQKRVVGYFPNYGMYNANQPYFATDIPFDKLNVISYCFGQFDGDGNVSSQDSWADSFNLPVIQYVLSRNPSLMGELLFGGWPDETDPKKDYLTMFKSISSDPVKRKNFAKNAVTAMLQIGFTGIGIDWEYPEGTDATNYLLLLKAIKQELNTVGANKYTLSVAAPASIDKIDVLNSDQWKQLSETVDFINVMTYDYNGVWGTITDFNTPLMTNPNNPNYNSNKDNCVDGTISHFLNIAKTCQISPTKFAMGIAAYGRGFLMDSGVVTNENQGLYVNHVPNKVPNTPDKTGIFKNYEILAKNNFPSDMELIDGSEGDSEKTIVTEQSAFGYSVNEGWFISFDNVLSLKSKLDYADQNGLGGVMIWDLSGDTNSDDTSLMKTISDFYKQ